MLSSGEHAPRVNSFCKFEMKIGAANFLPPSYHPIFKKKL